jgi:hypothetical protein
MAGVYRIRQDWGMASSALIVIDVQRGFDDPSWGPRDNPECERNVARLIEHWRANSDPLVFVRHDGDDPGSTLAPGEPGNAFKDVITGEPDLLVAKTRFVIDATHAFDRADPYGGVVTAAELPRVTATNLHGEFATVMQSTEIVRE